MAYFPDSSLVWVPHCVNTVAFSAWRRQWYINSSSSRISLKLGRKIWKLELGNVQTVKEYLFPLINHWIYLSAFLDGQNHHFRLRYHVNSFLIAYLCFSILLLPLKLTWWSLGLPWELRLVVGLCRLLWKRQSLGWIWHIWVMQSGGNTWALKTGLGPPSRKDREARSGRAPWGRRVGILFLLLIMLTGRGTLQSSNSAGKT